MTDYTNQETEMIYDGAAYKTVPHPWRRYFARTIDLSIYGLFYTFMVLYVFRHGGQNTWSNLLGSFIGIALMVAIEPLLLSRLGTTPGKWVFGLRVYHPSGGKLTYLEALERTFSVARDGMGFGIPLYNIYCQYKSYRLVSSNQRCLWEIDYAYEIEDTDKWRSGACVLALVLVMGIEILGTQYAHLPKHRGDITPEEFYENFNDLMKFHDLDTGYWLTSEGEWEQRPSSNGTVVHILVNPLPDIKVYTDDGSVVEVVIMDEANDGGWIYGSNNKAYVAYMAFVGTRSGINPFAIQGKEAMAYLNDGFEDYRFEKYGIEVSNQVDFEGYNKVREGLLVGQDHVDKFYSRTFRMRVMDD